MNSRQGGPESSSKLNIKSHTRFLALIAILGAQALVLSFVENMLPAVPGLPPGAKPGLSNIVTMFTASVLGFKGALLIAVLKAVFAGVTRGGVALVMSLCGGVLSAAVMSFLLALKKNPFGLTGISVLSATAHNAGQLCAACVISGTTKLIAGYGPLLLVFALVAGSITGVMLKILLPAHRKQSAAFGFDDFTA